VNAFARQPLAKQEIMTEKWEDDSEGKNLLSMWFDDFFPQTGRITYAAFPRADAS
jgi:hypothetical protein